MSSRLTSQCRAMLRGAAAESLGEHVAEIAGGDVGTVAEDEHWSHGVQYRGPDPARQMECPPNLAAMGKTT